MMELHMIDNYIHYVFAFEFNHAVFIAYLNISIMVQIFSGLSDTFCQPGLISQFIMPG